MDRLASSASSTASSARTKRAWPPRGPRSPAAASKDARPTLASEKDALKLYYLMYRDAGYQALLAEFARVSTEHREIELRSNTAMVMEERPDSKASGASAVSRDVRSAARAARREHARRSCRRWRRICRETASGSRAG